MRLISLRGVAPEHVFLVLGLLFGLAILYVNPLFRTPDEVRHYWRAYQVSDGGVMPILQDGTLGGTLPETIISLEDSLQNTDTPDRGHDPTAPFHALQKQLNTQPKSQEYRLIGFPNTALYSPAPYVGPVFAITAGKVLSLHPILTAHLARLCNLMIWLGICYVAIRIIPVGKWFVAALSLSPVAMQQAASMSADTLTNALCILLVSLVGSLMYAQHARRKDLFAILALSVTLALCKQPFFVLALLCLLIPLETLGGTKRYVLWNLVIIGASFGLALGWAFVVSHYFVATRTDVLINPSMQLQFSLFHPFAFAQALYHTYASTGLSLVRGSVGALGFGQIKLPIWATMLCFLSFALGLSLDGKQNEMNTKRKLWLLFLGVVVFGVTNLMLYMSWTAFSATHIDGVQGRYFIPLAALGAFLAFYVKQLRPFMLLLRILFVACLLTIGAVSVYTLFTA